MDRVTAYGHSWIDGDGASDPARCLVEVAAGQLGLPADNRGVGGSLSTATAELVRARPPGPSSVFVLMTGLNDARLHGPSPAARDAYATALEVILTTFRAVSPDAVVIAVEQPYLGNYSLHAPHNQGSDAILDAYNATLRQVAAGRSRTSVATVAGWDRRSMLSDDTVHPNDAGHAQMAGAVVRAVRAAAVAR